MAKLQGEGVIMTQLSIDFANERQHTGMKRAADHADRVRAGWTAEAQAHLVLYACKATQPFLAETVHEYAEQHGLPPPPDSRAWGAVMNRAHKKGLIRSAGVAKAKSSNMSYKVLWEAV